MPTAIRPSWTRGRLSRGILRAGDGPAVDREKRVIRGCALCTRGEALSHGFWLDSDFIDQTVLAGKALGERGVKARFTHPGMCSDGLGKFLGRWRNFRREGDVARADLFLAESASGTPSGDLAAYVLDLAEEDPEAFGASIVFAHDPDAEEELFEAHKEYDEEAGRKIFKSPDKDNATNLPHARLAAIHAADVVDEPAANPEGLFGRGSDLAERATRFLDWALSGEGPAPELEPAFGVSAERAREFLTAYLDRRSVRLSATPGATGASALKEDSMAGDKDKATPDVAALQAEAKAAGMEEGRKAVRGELEAMLAAFPADRAFALESFAKGLSVEAAKAAQADALAARVEQLQKENTELKGKVAPPPPPAAPAAGFASPASAGGDFLSVARTLAAEKGLSLAAAMSQVSVEQPELYGKYLAGK